MPIYAVQFAMRIDEVWFADDDPRDGDAVVRRESSNYAEIIVLEARNADEVYDRANRMTDALFYQYRGGVGERTDLVCLDVRNISRISGSAEAMVETVRDTYGMTIGTVCAGSVAAESRPREEFDIFKYPLPGE